MASYANASGCTSATVDQKAVAGQGRDYCHADKIESSLPTDAEWLASRQEVAALHQTPVGAMAPTNLQHPEQQRLEDHQPKQLFHWQTVSPASMSFGSASEPSTPSFDVYQARTGQSMFPGTHDFRFDAPQGSHKPQRRPTSYPHQQNHEQPQGQHSHAPMTHHHHHHLGMQGPPMSDAYAVFDLPNPSFDSTPDTPLFSPVDMLSHGLPISMPHEMGSNPAHLQVQQPAMPPQTQPAQQQVYTPVYDGRQLQYSSPDHHRHIYVPSVLPYESYNPPPQHGLPLQHAHGMPLHVMPTNIGYPQPH
ncbi:hypothetical protein Tdes44962_MAKER09097 [Teratosphaeria destructans]|uniref:Uncharacterized protein n=1 Tax=Teratosphaeria destructans TaxID=418781 RepID=A0A9W7SUI3_9PEZI|nr:hypothetical protein Tdes44962_MAKER09097 [Teratosphaeria destructans]